MANENILLDSRKANNLRRKAEENLLVGIYIFLFLLEYHAQHC